MSATRRPNGRDWIVGATACPGPGAIVALVFLVARVLFPRWQPECANARAVMHLACALVLLACAVQRLESVRVTKDAIGGLQLDRPLSDLKSLAQNARDTTIAGVDSTWPGVAFHYPELLVVGAQHRQTLDSSRPADAWTLVGCGGRLPNDVPLCANWQELTRAFGDSGVGSSKSGPAVVRLCGLPNFEFQLDVSENTVGSLEAARSLSRVPGTARVTRVSILRSVPAECG